METGANQSLTCLSTNTSIGLLKRQLSEWKTLLQNQKQARGLTLRQEPTYVRNLSQPNEMLSKKVKQLQQLGLLSARQSEERQKLYLHHQQEVAELDRVLAAHQPGSATS